MHVPNVALSHNLVGALLHAKIVDSDVILNTVFY